MMIEGHADLLGKVNHPSQGAAQRRFVSLMILHLAFGKIALNNVPTSPWGLTPHDLFDSGESWSTVTI